MKSRFWGSDWFAGLVITIVVVVLTLFGSFNGLERSFYDWGVRSTDRTPSDKIAIIAIDDESIVNFESWPWPRDLHAALIDRLNEGGAKVIGHTVLFVDPQRQAGLDYIRDLIEFFSNASFNDVPADIDTLGAMLEIQGNNKEITEILEFYLQSSVNTRLSQDIRMRFSLIV
jgi:serine/threonine-protein kinase